MRARHGHRRRFYSERRETFVREGMAIVRVYMCVCVNFVKVRHTWKQARPRQIHTEERGRHPAAAWAARRG